MEGRARRFLNEFSDLVDRYWNGSQSLKRNVFFSEKAMVLFKRHGVVFGDKYISASESEAVSSDLSAAGVDDLDDSVDDFVKTLLPAAQAALAINSESVSVTEANEARISDLGLPGATGPLLRSLNYSTKSGKSASPRHTAAEELPIPGSITATLSETETLRTLRTENEALKMGLVRDRLDHNHAESVKLTQLIKETMQHVNTLRQRVSSQARENRHLRGTVAKLTALNFGQSTSTSRASLGD